MKFSGGHFTRANLREIMAEADRIAKEKGIPFEEAMCHVSLLPFLTPFPADYDPLARLTGKRRPKKRTRDRCGG